MCTDTETNCLGEFKVYQLFLDPGRIPFSYLEDIHMRFMKNYGRVAQYALAYAMNDEFSRVLHQQMEFFSSNPSADTLNRVRGEVGEASIFFSAGTIIFYLSFCFILHLFCISSCIDACSLDAIFSPFFLVA